jgi:hypothetical protein
MLDNIWRTTNYIKSRIGDFVPEVGIILGTGLGGLVQEIEIEKQMIYANIPDFPISSLFLASWLVKMWWPCRGVYIFTKGITCSKLPSRCG